MFGREKRFRRSAGTDTEYDSRGNVATAERPTTGNGNGTADATPGNGNGTAENGGATTVREPAAREPAVRDRAPRGRGAAAATTGAVAVDREARLRQRERFGGMNWGSAFFGWLVAVGMGVILTAIVAAAGTAIGLTNGASKSDAGTIGIVGGALLIAVSFIAYYCGGYVAGRMSRFDGARQGFGAWAIGLIVTLLVAAAGAIFGDQYNVFDKLNLPRIPLNASDITTGGIITLVAIVVATLIGAVLGGKLGQRYHWRVDRAAMVD